MMEFDRAGRCLCSLILLVGFVSILTESKSDENIFDSTRRFTHAFINGDVRGHGHLPTTDQHAYLIVELRLTRDDRPRSIARMKRKLHYNNTANHFTLPFKLKYPLTKISPHNTYMLSAKIHDRLDKLLYVGHLPVPVTEQKAKQAKHLLIPVVETRKRSIENRHKRYFSCSIVVQQHRQTKSTGL
jgi:hypothetical protein